MGTQEKKPYQPNGWVDFSPILSHRIRVVTLETPTPPYEDDSIMGRQDEGDQEFVCLLQLLPGAGTNASHGSPFPEGRSTPG